jgi:hypothetical protein
MLRRSIQHIPHFRSDISPFLVHLTRSREGKSAAENLTAILAAEFLVPSFTAISDARFAVRTSETSQTDFFAATSFSETPLGEIHCLFEIGLRAIQLEPYGLVFLKDRLSARGVSPVIYINNQQGDKDQVVRALASLRKTHPEAARQILPLVSVFGQKLQPVGGTLSPGQVDFRWEREWRLPTASGLLGFERDDLFVGLCPHEEIRAFEKQYPLLQFIDPRRNVKWYASKLVRARRRAKLKYSVV